jgi:hypothetical protein
MEAMLQDEQYEECGLHARLMQAVCKSNLNIMTTVDGNKLKDPILNAAIGTASVWYWSCSVWFPSPCRPWDCAFGKTVQLKKR